MLQKEKTKKMPKVYYLCDRRACERCFEDCCATTDISHAVNFHRTELGGYCENGSNIKSIEDQVKNDSEPPIEEPKREVTLNPHEQYVFDYARNRGISVDEAYASPTVKAHLNYFNNFNYTER
jgi:nitrate reductase beta subunit